MSNLLLFKTTATLSLDKLHFPLFFFFSDLGHIVWFQPQGSAFPVKGVLPGTTVADLKELAAQKMGVVFTSFDLIWPTEIQGMEVGKVSTIREHFVSGGRLKTEAEMDNAFFQVFDSRGMNKIEVRSVTTSGAPAPPTTGECYYLKTQQQLSLLKNSIFPPFLFFRSWTHCVVPCWWKFVES